MLLEEIDALDSLDWGLEEIRALLLERTGGWHPSMLYGCTGLGHPGQLSYEMLLLLGMAGLGRRRSHR